MRNSVVEPANVLEKHLKEIPVFVSAYSSKENGIVDRWLEWLTSLEAELEKHNLSQSAQIAVQSKLEYPAVQSASFPKMYRLEIRLLQN